MHFRKRIRRYFTLFFVAIIHKKYGLIKKFNMNSPRIKKQFQKHLKLLLKFSDCELNKLQSRFFEESQQKGNISELI